MFKKIKEIGLKTLEENRKFIKIKKRVELKLDDKSISIEPSSESLKVAFTLSYENNPLIRSQTNCVDFKDKNLENIYSARTFCLYEDIEKVKSLLDNNIGIKISFICASGARSAIVANYFFKNYIIEKIQNKYQYLNDKIRNNQLLAVGLLRFLGGIPTQIQNLIPVLFDVKLKNYFFGTLLGVIIQAFIVCSLGSALEKKIYENDELPEILAVSYTHLTLPTSDLV